MHKFRKAQISMLPISSTDFSNSLDFEIITMTWKFHFGYVHNPSLDNHYCILCRHKILRKFLFKFDDTICILFFDWETAKWYADQKKFFFPSSSSSS